ncbi:MAG: hypothetical protein D6731_24835 [Planctomycetota bacterium]|nr:MAG: hypothetical protein D6731_24835 [Planctomycetota bacterium]
MTCDDLDELLGTLSARVLPAAAREHLDGCAPCAALAEEYRRLDDFFFAEAVPLAPPDFVASVLSAARALDPTAELRALRLQALLPLAAACLVAAGLVFGIPGMGETSVAPDLVPSAAEAVALAQSLWQGASARANAALEVALSTAPAPPLAALAVAAPLLLLVNWGLTRSALASKAQP